MGFFFFSKKQRKIEDEAIEKRIAEINKPAAEASKRATTSVKRLTTAIKKEDIAFNFYYATHARKDSK